MLAEIITIGDEILIGQIVDTNSAFISKALNKIGVSVYQITSIQDDKAHILKALKEAEQNANIIIITGGLGPTKDDITKTTIANYFNDTLVVDKAALDNITHLWQNVIKKPLQQVNIDQALMPSKSETLINTVGSASGIWINNNNKTFVALPGVPYEMKALITNAVIPKLEKTYQLPYIEHQTIITYGVGESVIAEQISEFENNLPHFIKLAYLPSLGSVRLRLSAKDTDKNKVVTTMQQQINLLKPLLKNIDHHFDNEPNRIMQIGALLKANNLKLAVAESCTGGEISKQITANPGVSAFYNGGITTYATQSKIDVLGISTDIIKTYGVVSTKVAEAMANGVKKLYNSAYAIATTGVAGPSKGDSNTDVGTVIISIATPNYTISKQFNFGKNRFRVIQKATYKAFELLEKEILKNC